LRRKRRIKLTYFFAEIAAQKRTFCFCAGMPHIKLTFFAQKCRTAIRKTRRKPTFCFCAGMPHSKLTFFEQKCRAENYRGENLPFGTVWAGMLHSK
jgi:hypothetical protein